MILLVVYFAVVFTAGSIDFIAAATASVDFVADVTVNVAVLADVVVADKNISIYYNIDIVFVSVIVVVVSVLDAAAAVASAVNANVRAVGNVYALYLIQNLNVDEIERLF